MRHLKIVADLTHAFQLSFVTSETALPIPAVSEILGRLRSGPVWDAASITPADGQFPRLHADWHEGRGFVIQCYEDEQASSDFLVTGVPCGVPAIEINPGGQALERWPAELFVSEEPAHRAFECFLASGKQDPALHWIRIDAFHRETVWEGREGREAWERANSRSKDVQLQLEPTARLVGNSAAPRLMPAIGQTKLTN